MYDILLASVSRVYSSPFSRRGPIPIEAPCGVYFIFWISLLLRRLARKVARGSVDRTAYSPKYSLSFMSHHAERISLSVVRGVNRAIRSHLATLSARLARA